MMQGSGEEGIRRRAGGVKVRGCQVPVIAARIASAIAGSATSANAGTAGESPSRTGQLRRFRGE